MKKAYTLAEIMICVTIIGFLAIAMFLNIKPDTFKKKSNIASAYKAIDEFEKASQKIREKETQAVPSGDFMTKVLDEYEYSIINDDGTPKDATQVLELFSQYMKIENVGEEFCENTGYCSTGDSYVGAKLTNEIHVGLEILDSIEDCPEKPGTDGENTNIEGEEPQTSIPLDYEELLSSDTLSDFNPYSMTSEEYENFLNERRKLFE